MNNLSLFARGIFIFFLIAATACQQQQTERKVVIEKQACQPERGNCKASVGQASIIWQTDTAIQYLKPVEIKIESTVPLKSASMMFSMTSMDMGLNRYPLKQVSPSQWHAQVVLPVCVSGRRDWLAELEFDTVDGSYYASFVFNVSAN